MNDFCGCCEGIEQLTPLPIVNRPGLDVLVYRVGTHASFLETMIANLSNLGDLRLLQPAPDDSNKPIIVSPLRSLTTRAMNDPAIALLDAWATVADVLTFYQERIANEGYLRTATERRSILELARLVGYSLRPGVAASVFLAYTLEKDHNITLLPGNRVQSVPAPGELPQSFETAEKLEARYDWNTLKPRLTRPQVIRINEQNTPPQVISSASDGSIYFQGTTIHLKEGDPLLFTFDNGANAFPIISKVEIQTAANRTRVELAPIPQTSPSTPIASSTGETASLRTAALRNLATASSSSSFPFLKDIVRSLKEPPSIQPANTQLLKRNVAQAFAEQSDTHLQILVKALPALQSKLYKAIANVPPIPNTLLHLSGVHSFQVKAAPFGHNAPLQQDTIDGQPLGQPHEWELALSNIVKIDLQFQFNPDPPNPNDMHFGGKSIKMIVATITHDDKEMAQTKQNISGEPQTINLSLDHGIKLQIKVEPSQIDGLPFSEIELTYSGLGFDEEKIDIKDLSSSIGVTIDKDAMWTLTLKGGQEYLTAQHRVQMEFGDKALSIVEELPAAVNRNILPIDAQYDKIVPGSQAVIVRPDKIISTIVQGVQTVSMAAYGITGRVTQLTLKDDWLETTYRSLSDIRGITVYAQSEEQALAEEPFNEDIGTPPAPAGVATKSPMNAVGVTDNLGQKVTTDTIELDRLYDGLHSGQRLIVSGERTDIPSNGLTITGVTGSELVMLKSATQEVQQIPNPAKKDGSTIALPGDTKHTYLHLANKLAYTYKRDTLTINANVVRATHGETRTEVLGSGNGSKALQQFTLRQSPLTYVPASTSPAGVESTLQVRVNDILWHEADHLIGLKSTDRNYITEADDTDKTTVIFGNGQYGARLPTGIENVTAVYRTGIGRPGNVKEGQLTLLATKPLGVKSVTNPLRASGGADKEDRDQARRNVSLATLALDRLVSVQDYADFARTFAGIGKTSAISLPDKHRQLVHLSIVGADNIPIDTTSDLYLNLVQALRQFGDTNQLFKVDLADVLFLVISAKVRLLPDYQLESVEPKIRATLLDTFSFERRELGEPVFQSEVFSAIQGVPGVDYVDLETMGALDEKIIINALAATQDTGGDEAGEPKETDEEGETEEQEHSEEFLELLGLKGYADVQVNLARIDTTDPDKSILPAQLAFLSPDVPDTLIITELSK